MTKVNIVYDKDVSIWLTINGNDISKVLNYNERLKIYKFALKNLNKDITTSYNQCKNNKNAEFLWLITAKNLRSDGLVDSIHFYYLYYLIDYFLADEASSFLQTNIFLPPFFKRFLQKKYGKRFLNSFSPKKFLFYKSRQWLHPIKRIKSILHLVNLFSREVNEGQVMLQSSSDFKKMRFRGFEKRFEEESCLLFPKDLFHSVRNIMSGHKLVNLTLRSFISTFLKALWLGFAVQKKINNRVATLYEMNLGAQVYSQSVFVVWRQLLTEAIMRKYRPSEVIVVQTFGDPQSRYLTFAGEKYEAKTTIFSCRPMITDLRPEDAILPFEISKKKKPLYGLGQQLFVFDKFSINSVARSGYPKSRIKVHKPLLLSGYGRGKKLLKGFILLLAGEEMNLQLFPLLKSFAANNSKYKFYLKNHPLLEFTKKEKYLIESVFHDQAIDLSKEYLHELDLTEVVAFTTYSTSGVEAVAQGAGLVWLPFLTERSIQFAEVFDKVGKVVYDQNNFLQTMNQLQNKDYFFSLIKESQAEYTKEFQIS